MSVFTNAAYLLGHIRTEDHIFYNRVSEPFATTSETLAESYGGSYPTVSGGTRVAANVLSKNPLMTKPSVAGMRYFGQSSISKVCMDQALPRRMGQFPTPQHGSGMNFHDFNTNPVFAGSQNVAGVTGALLYGGQFKNVTGASALISGSLATIALSAITNLLSLSLPDSLQSSISGLSSMSSALTSLTSGGFGGSVPIINVFRTFSAFSFPDPTSALLSSAITGVASSVLGGGGLSSMTSSVTSILGTAQGFNGSLSSISPASALNGIGGGTFLLQNALDQALNNLIPGASMVISSTFSSVNNISSLSGASPTETLRFNDRDAMISYSSAATQSFSSQDRRPYDNDIYNRGFSMSGTVSEYITRRNSKAV